MKNATQNDGMIDGARFYRLRDVLKIFPVSRSQIWKMVKEGKFPSPVKLSQRCTVWCGSELNDHRQKIIDRIN